MPNDFIGQFLTIPGKLENFRSSCRMQYDSSYEALGHRLGLSEDLVHLGSFP